MAEPFADSLCQRCRHGRRVEGKASVFLLCTALAEKYPRQPVRACPAFEARPPPPEGGK